MVNVTQPMQYRRWYQSELGQNLKWLFPTQSSVAYFLREHKEKLLEEKLIEVIPGRGYFINSDKFNLESVKPFFFVGK
jgi:hypothetical protein